MKTAKDGWSKRFKGSKFRGGAFIYTHPDVKSGRAIVENHNGIQFNGVLFKTLDDAKRAALESPPKT